MAEINLPDLGEPEAQQIRFGRQGRYGTVSVPIGDNTFTAGLGIPQAINGQISPMFGATHDYGDGSVGVKVDPRMIQLLLKHRF